MKNFIIIFLLITQLNTILDAGLEEELFQEYQPSLNKCRPNVRSSETEGYERGETILKPLYNSNGSIVCMLAGYKNVYFGNLDELDSISASIKELLKLKNYKYITNNESSLEPVERPFILFTPDGRKNALLLLKSLELRINNYLQGHLLGYSDKDISALYKWQSQEIEKYKSSPIEADLRFENDRKEALKWIEENSSDIEEWANTNKIIINDLI